MAAVLLPRRRVPALALAGWTLLTWVTRVPLFVADDELGAGDKALSALPVAVFVVLAAVTAAAVVRRSVRGDTAVRALAGWSLAYWAVRLPLILVNDHPVPFYVVHAVLALTAGALSVLALVRLSAEGRGIGAGPDARAGARSSV